MGYFMLNHGTDESAKGGDDKDKDKEEEAAMAAKLEQGRDFRLLRQKTY